MAGTAAAAAAAAASSGESARVSAATTTPSLPTTAGVEIASVSGGTLSVTDLASGKATTIPSDDAQDPGFSHDGRYVAYVETAGNSSSVHVIPLAGGRATTVKDASSYAWSTAGDELAVSLPKQVELISAGGATLRRWAMREPLTAVFSPSGTEIAVGSGADHSGHGSLHMLPVDAVAHAGSGPRVSAAPQHSFRESGCPLPAGWTADGSHILFWQDEDCSASIAADGLPLDSVSTAAMSTTSNGGRAPRIVTLGTTLPYPGWVVPVSGAKVLLDLGGDRIAADHKRLSSCDAATGRCAALPLRAGVTTLDPAVLTSSDQLFEVRVAQSTAPNDFLPRGTLWTATLAGKGAHELTAAGRGVADPTPIAGGTEVIFVRMTSDTLATVQEITVRTGAVHMIAKLDVDDVDDYYGEFRASDALAVWQPSPATTARAASSTRSLARAR